MTVRASRAVLARGAGRGALGTSPADPRQIGRGLQMPGRGPRRSARCCLGTTGPCRGARRGWDLSGNQLVGRGRRARAGRYRGRGRRPIGAVDVDPGLLWSRTRRSGQDVGLDPRGTRSGEGRRFRQRTGEFESPTRVDQIGIGQSASDRLRVADVQVENRRPALGIPEFLGGNAPQRVAGLHHVELGQHGMRCQ
jgi:hypothetical protein